MQKNTVIDTGSMTFTFSDKAGNQFAWFNLNPTDPRILRKCKNLADVFDTAGERITSHIAWEELVEQQFCDFLGYDCRKSLFGRIAATDIMNDGRIFAFHILDVIIANVGPEIKKRRAKNLARYTAKYTND